MEQSLVMDLLREIAVGFKAARSYPLGHPVMDKAVNNTMIQLTKIFPEMSEFSMYFFEKTIILEDLRVDVGKNMALLALLDSLRKNEINSLTFTSAVGSEDINNLYEVLASPKLKIKQYGDVATMLVSKGTKSIKINAIQFGIKASEEETKSHEEIIEAIRELMEFVKKNPSTAEARDKFQKVINDVERAPKEGWHAYNEALADFIDQLPMEHRVALLEDIEIRPFILRLLSKLSTETLTKLIIKWSELQKQTNISKTLGAIGQEKFLKMVPALKEKIFNLYEYLAQAGVDLLLKDDIYSTITKDDLRVAINPYYNMLDSQNAGLREEALKSLMKLAMRLLKHETYDMADGIMLRIGLAFEQETVNEIIIRLIDDLNELFLMAKKHNQEEFCSRLLEPFRRISGRPGLSIPFRKQLIKFMSNTGDPAVLPMLFTFVWEAGLYPDTRSAIIKFGKDAVKEAVFFLRDAEDFAIRMKLVDILKNIGPTSYDVLIDGLKAEEWYLRRNIVRIIGDIGDPGILHRLAILHRDKDARVRIELASTYAKLDYREGLLKCLDDSHFEVKAEALRGLKKKLSAEEVIELLPSFQDTGDPVYIEVLKIIDEKKIFEAAGWIAEMLKSLESRDEREVYDLKDLGVTTLARLNTENAKIILEDLKSSSRDRSLVHLVSVALKRIK